jgi:hypothetical protein
VRLSIPCLHVSLTYLTLHVPCCAAAIGG